MKNLIMFLTLLTLLLAPTMVLAFDATISPLTPLRVSAFPYLTYAPLYIADAEGFFAQQGLKVEFVHFQRKGDSLTALLRGDVDVDSIFTAGLLNVIGRGGKVRVVADKSLLLSNGCTAAAFLVRKGLFDQISEMSPAALRKLTFGVDPTWLDSYFLQRFLAARDVHLRDVTTQYLPDPAVRIEALRQGALDVAFLTEPWITRAKESNAGVVWASAEEIIPGYPLGILSFGPSLLERKDDIGVRFLRAYLQGIARYSEGKTLHNIEILSRVTHIDADLLMRVCWPVFSADGQIDAQAVSRYSSWTTTQGLTDQALSPEQFWDPSFVVTARETLNAQIPSKP